MADEKPADEASGEEPLNVGDCYEFTHGPASAPERTMRGVLEEIDTTTNTYTFRLEDASKVSLVDHEIDGARRIAEGC